MRLIMIIGGVLSLGSFTMAIMLGSPLWVFYDFYTVFLMGFLPVFFVVQAHGTTGLRTLQQAVKRWCSSNDDSITDGPAAIVVVETIRHATPRAAHVCMLIGWIQILQAAGPDNLEVVGPAMAVMFLSLFYACCLNFVVWGPLSRWLQQASTVPDNAQHA